MLGGSSELRLELKECCDKSLTTVPPFLDSSFGQHCQAKVNPNDDDRPPQPSCNSSFFFSFSFLLSLNKFSEENSLDKKKQKKEDGKRQIQKRKKKRRGTSFFFFWLTPNLVPIVSRGIAARSCPLCALNQHMHLKLVTVLAKMAVGVLCVIHLFHHHRPTRGRVSFEHFGDPTGRGQVKS